MTRAGKHVCPQVVYIVVRKRMQNKCCVLSENRPLILKFEEQAGNVEKPTLMKTGLLRRICDVCHWNVDKDLGSG